MRTSAITLLAILSWGTVLGGCSGLPTLWRGERARKAAAERSIEGPLTLARLAEQRGKLVEAERLYRSILEKSPDHPVIYHRLAIMQSRKGRFEEANVYFDRALQLKPDDPGLISDAGYCYYLQERLDVAEALFRQVLEIDPHHEAASNNLALVLGETGDEKAAFALFRQTGNEARAHANMGFVYTRRGELEKAKTAYSRALSLDPQMIVAGEALVQLAQLEKEAKAIAAPSYRPGTNRSDEVVTVDFQERVSDAHLRSIAARAVANEDESSAFQGSDVVRAAAVVHESDAVHAAPTPHPSEYQPQITPNFSSVPSFPQIPSIPDLPNFPSMPKMGSSDRSQ